VEWHSKKKQETSNSATYDKVGTVSSATPTLLLRVHTYQTVVFCRGVVRCHCKQQSSTLVDDRVWSGGLCLCGWPLCVRACWPHPRIRGRSGVVDQLQSHSRSALEHLRNSDAHDRVAVVSGALATGRSFCSVLRSSSAQRSTSTQRLSALGFASKSSAGRASVAWHRQISLR